MKFLHLERWIKNKSVREWVEALLFAIIVASIFRTWLYTPFRVPTSSMVPTILVGDHLLADMKAYGFRLPFADKRLFSEPIKNGDIIIFPDPKNDEICDFFGYKIYDMLKYWLLSVVTSNPPTCLDYVKRAVAVGGDILEIRGEQVYVNGILERDYNPYLDPELAQLPVYLKLAVPDGKVFAMGDNRRNSHDSRFWGYVDEKEVRGQGKFIFFSADPQQSFTQGWRWNRIGHSLK